MDLADHRMRVLLLTTEYPPAPDIGGIGAYLAAAAEALVEAGADVHVLCCRRGVAAADVTGPGGEQVHVRPIRRRHSALLGRFGLAPAVPLAREARPLGRFDVVEAPDWEAAGLAFTFGARRRRTPVVVCLHTPTAIVRRHGGTAGNRLRELLERWTAARADAVLTYSPLLVEELRGLGWPLRGPLAVQAPCLERALLERPVAPVATEPVVLGVGRFEPRKGFELLVRTAACLAPDVPGLRIVLVGRDVADEHGRLGSDRLRELAGRHDVELELVAPVARSELGQWYDQARVVAVPSGFESFSMVALEALAHGRPVVCTPTVGFGVLAADHEPGAAVRVVPPEPEAFAAALRPLLSDAGKAADASADASALVRRMADPAAFAARRLAVYRSLATG